MANEKEDIVKLRDSLATLQWKSWEQMQISKRNDISIDHYPQFVENKLAVDAI